MLAGTSGSSHNRYLCNQTCLAVRHYLAKYYNSPYVCEDCGAASKVCAEEESAEICLEPIDCAAEHLGRMRFGVLQDIPSGSMHISSGSEAFPCPLAGCNGSMARKFSSHDLYTQLSYLRYLFDHERQRDNLQAKRACYHVASTTSRQLRLLQFLNAHRSPESVSSCCVATGR
eukprot:COSAG02_NODE_692_length_18432_cov_12.452681_12_plen_173_part_00